MRKVMFAMNVSIDGCYEHTHFSPDVELMRYFTQLMLDTGLIVYGRKTYELMIPYWPDVAKSKSGDPGDVAFAEAMTPIPKIVLSHTLKNGADNASIVNEEPGALIRQLRQQPGKKIAFSSVSLLPQMLSFGLIDELYLVVHPVLVGSDKRLFEGLHLPEQQGFKLITSQPFQSGAIALHYQKND